MLPLELRLVNWNFKENFKLIFCPIECFSVKNQCDESKQQRYVWVERIEDLERKFNELEASGLEKQFEPITEKSQS